MKYKYCLCFQFRNADDAKKALEQLNGFELAGRPMKVGNVTERTDLIQGPSLLDTDELDRSGIDLGATGRYVENIEKHCKIETLKEKINEIKN